MATRINYNYEAAVTYTSLKQNERLMNKSLLRLSTGLRILSAADDASGLFIADQLSLVSTGLEQGNRNIQFAISALQIAEGGVAQIYDKLKTMYQKAVSAANDINDPNARAALQRDIQNLADAIQKIGTDTEYNGIKLLDGTFADKYVHYGARSEQTLTVSIGDVRAQSLGAYVLNGTGQVDEGNDTVANVIGGSDFEFATTETINIAGISINGYGGLTDAKYIADYINGDSTAQELGIKAKAWNIVRGAVWQNIVVGDDDTVTINFYIGTNATTPSISLNFTSGEVITLDKIVKALNDAASQNNLNLVAKAQDGRLIIETNGETVAVEINITDAGAGGSGTSIPLANFVENATITATDTDGATSTNSVVKVGNLRILGPNSFSYNLTGIAGAFGLSGGLATTSLTNLNALDVTTKEGAELAMDIIDIAIKKVDTIRSEIGSTIINLQAVHDAQAIAKDNTDNAESIIRNVDFAKEMTEFTKYQIRMQSGIAMLAQANSLPQLVLQLLR